MTTAAVAASAGTEIGLDARAVVRELDQREIDERAGRLLGVLEPQATGARPTSPAAPRPAAIGGVLRAPLPLDHGVPGPRHG